MLTPGLAWSGKLISWTLRMVYWRYSKWQKRNQENGTAAMANVGQTNDTTTDVQALRSCHFQSQKQGWKTAKLGLRRAVDPTIN